MPRALEDASYGRMHPRLWPVHGRWLHQNRFDGVHLMYGTHSHRVSGFARRTRMHQQHAPIGVVDGETVARCVGRVRQPTQSPKGDGEIMQRQGAPRVRAYFSVAGIPHDAIDTLDSDGYAPVACRGDHKGRPLDDGAGAATGGERRRGAEWGGHDGPLTPTREGPRAHRALPLAPR